MKSIILSIALLAMGQLTFAQNAEEEAIKNIIIKETLSFYYCDAAAWESTMLPVDHHTWTVTTFNDPGSAATGQGLSFINNMKNYLNSGNCKKSEPKIKYSDWNIQIRGNVAWAAYKERTTMPDDTEIDAYTMKILEKQDGVWKISATSSVWDFNHASKPWNPKEGMKAKN
ncbi:MAG: hypothetical protein ACK4TA_11795 [Saprospiraceae bacterium]